MRLPVDLDQLLQHSDHPQTRDGVRHLDPKHLAITLIDHIERPVGSPAVERVRHEVQRPDLVQYRGCLQRLSKRSRNHVVVREGWLQSKR